MNWFAYFDIKIVLMALLLLYAVYFGGFCVMAVEDDIPWGPEFEHDIEMEFTPMDPRDYPGQILTNK